MIVYIYYAWGYYCLKVNTGESQGKTPEIVESGKAGAVGSMGWTILYWEQSHYGLALK